MVDFNVNLVKSMTSSPEQRARFYNRMLIYLSVCAIALVGTAFLSSRSIVIALQANKERKALMESVSTISAYGKGFYASPKESYEEFSNYASDLETLRSALEQRSRFLPVMSLLFSGFPKNVALQSLEASAADGSIEFVLSAPVLDEQGNDVFGTLQKTWRGNQELRSRARGVTQLTSEREMVGNTMMANVKYRCIVK